MRAALAVFLLAVTCLAASSVARLRGAAPAADPPDPAATLARFEATHQATEVDVGALYAGRLELLDPRRALPSWHRHDHDEAARAAAALSQCPPVPVDALADASLARALAWHARSCAAGVLDDEALALDRPPFVHPSGRSYAALALAGGHLPADRVRDHIGAFHVLELASLDPAALAPERRALASLPAEAWQALGRGDAVALAPAWLLLARHGPFGLASLRLYPRPQWDAFARRASIELAARAPLGPCPRPASPGLCWQGPARPASGALAALTVASAALTLASALALAALSALARRRAHLDRVHVLRTLTHELRTPATNLRLDIEPLRAAYDELPPSCQEPLLRLSDGIERLVRVLHRTARYMALFETPGAAREQLVRAQNVPSARALFEEFSDEWPEGVSLDAASADAPLVTDPEWLGLAVRNLVENGLRHGQPPLSVCWAVDRGSLVVRVTDRGTSHGFSLRRAVRPFDRAEGSPGLGLGLSLVDRVARLLGGRLSHEPSPTSFVLRLPARSAP